MDKVFRRVWSGVNFPRGPKKAGSLHRSQSLRSPAGKFSLYLALLLTLVLVISNQSQAESTSAEKKRKTEPSKAEVLLQKFGSGLEEKKTAAKKKEPAASESEEARAQARRHKSTPDPDRVGSGGSPAGESAGDRAEA